MVLKHIMHQTTASGRLVFALILGFTLFITGCTTPIQPSDTTSVPLDGPQTSSTLITAREATLKLPQPQREQQLILIARQQLEIDDIGNAGETLALIETTGLSDQDYIDYSIPAGMYWLLSQSLTEAHQLLMGNRLTQLESSHSVNQEIDIRSLKADLYKQLGNIDLSLRERIIIGSLLSETEQIIGNNNSIWQQLSILTAPELDELRAATTDALLISWLELASTSLRNQGDLERQLDAVLTWTRLNPNHPASLQLPSDLALLQEYIAAQPNQIALLLPMQGKLAKAGNAIRDGFFAAYYNSYDQQNTLPSVTLYDSSNTDIISLYDQAINQGADIVIGPLQKSQVEALSQHTNLTVPTIALNQIDPPITTDVAIATTPTNPYFYQFSLSVEGEAEQVADRAWLEGHRRAVVLSTNKSQWEQRTANRFIEDWEEKGGTVISQISLDNIENFSEDIERLLHIDQSNNRLKELQKLFGQRMEFEPRRRRDVDMIFLISRPLQGRQIKPILNFHYASNIPVYATSHIFSAANSKEKNQDLNGIRFTALPWIINPYIQEKNLVEENIKVTPGYERLYALGTDSFLLYPRLKQLSELKEQQLYGATGQLSIDGNQQVKRKQLWAEIHRGEIRPLKLLSISSDSISNDAISNDPLSSEQSL